METLSRAVHKEIALEGLYGMLDRHTKYNSNNCYYNNARWLYMAYFKGALLQR